MKPSEENQVATVEEQDDRATASPRAHVVAWPVIMLFVLAYVETICYLGLFQTLTGYISGATILLATEYFRSESDIITKTLVLVVFALSTFIWVIFKQHYSGWRYFESMLFIIEASLLTLFMIVATSLLPLVSVDAPETMVIVVISVCAMSLHNVHSLQVMPNKAPIAITGLFGNLANSAVSLFTLLRTGRSTSAATVAFRQLLYPLIAFFSGAFFGAFRFSSVGFFALAGPVAILIFMAAYSIKVQRE